MAYLDVLVSLAPRRALGMDQTIVHEEFDTSIQVPTSTQLRDIYTHHVIPEQTNYQTMNEVSFFIDDRDKTWTDLSNLKLEISFKFMKNAAGAWGGTNFETGFVENNIFDTLFEKVELEIGNHTVRTEGNYAMRAYIERITTLQQHEYDDTKVMEGFFPPAVGEDVNGGETANAAGALLSPSIGDRQKLSNASGLIRYIGTLKNDLTEQNKMMIPGTPVRVRLTKNSARFACRSTEATSHIQWDEMILHVNRSTLQESEDVKYRSQLIARKIASYPIRRKNVTSVIIPQASSISIPRFISGMIPRRLYVGFVRNQALAGDLTMNPFYFEDMEIEEMWLNYDGKEFPSRHYKTDFRAANKNVANKRAYDMTREVMMPIKGIGGAPFLSYTHWLNGHTLFSFDLTQDRSGFTGDSYKTVRRTGDVALELRLRGQPGHTMTAIVYAEYDNEIQVRAIDKEIVYDW